MGDCSAAWPGEAVVPESFNMRHSTASECPIERGPPVYQNRNACYAYAACSGTARAVSAEPEVNCVRTNGLSEPCHVWEQCPATSIVRRLERVLHPPLQARWDD